MQTKETSLGMPDTKVSVRELFNIESDMQVPAFSQASEHTPDLDKDYLFDRDTTLFRSEARACRGGRDQTQASLADFRNL